MAKKDLGELEQIVDFDGNFVCNIDKWMAERHLKDVGFDYSVVTILGTQSSGKSTLLNALFGTSFQVMDSQLGHSQTTKGLWIGVDRTLKQNNIIIDVEGTDSKERGDQRLTFEHRAALFSLALADCVLVNIWYSSLGCYTASNYSLLKTVMEVNLELFQQQRDTPKTVLLFVVRDWSPVMTPLDVIKQKIKREYIDAIWREIHKPEKLENSTAEEFFNYKVVGLAHRFMMPDQFFQDVKDLQHLYIERLRPRSYSRHIPSDGFPTYCVNIWETIKNQSQLDIPSQKEMLSSFRCQEIKNAVFNELKIQIDEKLKEAQKSDTLEVPFGVFASNIVRRSTEMYMEDACRYQQEICRKVKAELIESLCVELEKVAEAHLSHVKQKLGDQFTAQVEGAFKKKRNFNEDLEDENSVLSVWANFNTTCSNLQSEKLRTFDEAKENCEVKGEDFVRRFDVKAVRDALAMSMSKDVSRIRDKHQAQFSSFLQSSIMEDLEGISDLFLQRELKAKAFWNSVGDLLIYSKKKNAKKLEKCFFGLGEKRKIKENYFENFCAIAAFKQLKNKLSSTVNNIHTHIINRFQKFFSYDENDQPRQWPSLTSDKLSQIFLKSKEEALVLLDVLSDVRVDIHTIILPDENETLNTKKEGITDKKGESDSDSEDDEMEQEMQAYIDEHSLNKHDTVNSESKKVNSNLVLLSDVLRQTELQKALQKMQSICKEAQYIQATGGMASWRSIPLFFWLILLVFSYNEIASIFSFIFSSWLFLPLILGPAVAIGFAYYTGNLGNLMMLCGQISLAIKTFAIPFLSQLLSNAANSLQQQSQHLHPGTVEGGVNSTQATQEGSRRARNETKAGEVEMVEKSKQQKKKHGK